MKIVRDWMTADGVGLKIDPYTPRGSKRMFLDIITVTKTAEGDPAVVSWNTSALENPQRAEQMAAGLRRAAQLARKLDKGWKPKPIVQ